MGIFSSKTKISIFSNAIPLVDEEYNPMTQTVVSAVLNNKSIAQSLTIGVIAGTSMCVDNMLKYARSHYTLGLSQGTKHTTSTIDDADLAEIITTDLSLPYGCTIDYNYITELSIDHVILPFLVNTRGYNLATNRVATAQVPSGWNLPVTLSNDVSRILTHRVSVESVTYDLLTHTANIQYKVVSSYLSGNLYVDHTVAALPTVYYDETYIVPAGLRIGRTYCIAKYFKLDALGQVVGLANTWFYDIGTGLYPIIAPLATSDPTADFFPVVPIRYNNVDLTASAQQDTDLYKTSKQLLKRVNLDINFLGDKINDNPDVGEIDHAYVMFGVNLQSNKKESLLYLIEFFDALYDEAIITESEYLNFQLSGETVKQVSYGFNDSIIPGGTTTYTEINDNEESQITVVTSTTAASLTEHGLDTGILYNAIRSCYKAGSIGVPGTVTKEFIPGAVTQYNIFLQHLKTDNSQLILRHQITTSFYKEVVVTGLGHKNNIYNGATAETTISDLIADATNDNFIIPLHYGICKRLPLATRNNLYLQALHIVINGIHETEVKWYQTGFFKALAMVFTIVVAVLTQQYWMIAVTMVMEVLTRILPPEIMMVMKVVGVLYDLVTMNWGHLALATMADAAKFLGMVASIANLAQIPMQLRLMDTMGEMEDLATESAIKNKIIEDAWKDLDTSSFLDAGLLLNSPKLESIPNESPTAFYTRTLMNNAGLLTLNVVENYHESMLSLPEVNSYFSPSYS